MCGSKTLVGSQDISSDIRDVQRSKQGLILAGSIEDGEQESSRDLIFRVQSICRHLRQAKTTPSSISQNIRILFNRATTTVMVTVTIAVTLTAI